ncbi:MAG: RIP metalloprotease RseP [Burkholderiales bacterium]|nr:RIP metalloprotease RseP [Burkholderiales bacterium]
MSFLHTVLAFAVTLGVLVTFHELGHYVVARWCGVKVLRFSVGMGRVIWSKRFGRDQTEWALSVLPLGGYVKMLDIRDHEGEIAAEDMPREFTSQPVGKRIAIVLAGPLANFLLAIVILAGVYVHGMPEPVARVAVAESSSAQRAGLRHGDLITEVNGESVRSWAEFRWQLIQAVMREQSVRLTVQRLSNERGNWLSEVVLPAQALPEQDIDSELFDRLGMSLARPPALLGEIVPGGPAAAAGLQAGDQILKVDNQAVIDAVAFIGAVQAAPGRAVSVEGLRRGEPFSVSVTPRAERDGERTVGRIQAQVDMSAAMVVVQSGPAEAVSRAVRKTWDTSALTVRMLGKMLIGEASLKNITGPITIADYAGQTARIGWISFLSFIAFVSISLGVMNLLPIPVLDGGHLLYYAVELFSGRPVPERVAEVVQRAGLGVLMALMAVAVFNDINRLIG